MALWSTDGTSRKSWHSLQLFTCHRIRLSSLITSEFFIKVFKKHFYGSSETFFWVICCLICYIILHIIVKNQSKNHNILIVKFISRLSGSWFGRNSELTWMKKDARGNISLILSRHMCDTSILRCEVRVSSLNFDEGSLVYKIYLHICTNIHANMHMCCPLYKKNSPQAGRACLIVINKNFTYSAMMRKTLPLS